MVRSQIGIENEGVHGAEQQASSAQEDNEPKYDFEDHVHFAGSSRWFGQTTGVSTGNRQWQWQRSGRAAGFAF